MIDLPNKIDIAADIFNRLYESVLGYRPVSAGSMKPVHIANGFSKAITKSYSKHVKISQFIQPTLGGNRGLDQTRTLESLIQNNPNSPFKNFHGREEEFMELRNYSYNLLASEGGFYAHSDTKREGNIRIPKPNSATNYSSMSLANEKMITKDTFDRDIGEFAATLLNNNSLSSIYKKAITLDHNSQDPFTALFSLSFGEKVDVELNNINIDKNIHGNFLKILNENAEILATYEKEIPNRIKTIQRIIQFVVLSMCIHPQFIENNINERIPLLLSWTGNKNERIRNASHVSMNLVYEKFENWLAYQLSILIKKGDYDDIIPIDDFSDQNIIDYITNQLETKNNNEQIKEKRKYIFDKNKEIYSTKEIQEIFSLTLTEIYISEGRSKGNNPASFFKRIGTQIGFFYPLIGGKIGSKRLQPHAHIIDIIVRSIVPKGERMIVEDFLDKLWTNFGIILSNKIDQKKYLDNHNIIIDNYDLEENFNSFINNLEEMGLARKYADDAIFIGEINDN